MFNCICGNEVIFQEDNTWGPCSICYRDWVRNDDNADIWTSPVETTESVRSRNKNKKKQRIERFKKYDNHKETNKVP